MTSDQTEPSFSCPLPIGRHDHVVMAHGGGGTLMHELIRQVFQSQFSNPALDQQLDAACLEVAGKKLAFTTDSYVVNPLEFPGGDIGSLAVHGTVNDLAMIGARPLYLSTGFILEEGFPLARLQCIVQSMRRAADRAGVLIVTGDTKVVERGKGDGLFINTAGIGVIEHRRRIGPTEVRTGDVALVNGDLGRHGIAIMAARQGLAFETTLESDSAPLADLVLQLLDAGIEIHCLRDLTRGGLASAVNEIADAAQLTIRLEESAIPVCAEVQGACEMLGFDPLYVANEGRFIALVAPRDADRTLELMRAHPQGHGACRIGVVEARASAPVILKSKIGASRVLDMLSGEQLPRIC